MCLRTLQSESFLQIGLPRRLPVISNRIPGVSRSNASIAILVPKLVAVVTPLCPLCTGMSQMNSLIAHTLSQNQSLWIWCIQQKLWPFLWYFSPIVAKNWLPWQYPLVPCHQECLVWIGRPRKPPVISNHILAISRRVPKIGCHGNTPFCFVYGRVTDEFSDSTNPISKPNCAWICCIQVKLWPFLSFLAYFGQNLVSVATSLRLLQSEMSSFDWSTMKTPVISNRILVISCRNAFMAILVPKLVAMATPFVPCVRECHRWICQ